MSATIYDPDTALAHIHYCEKVQHKLKRIISHYHKAKPPADVRKSLATNRRCLRITVSKGGL